MSKSNTREKIFFFLFIFAASAIAVGPTFYVDIPAMEDYLDHLSRMYIIVMAETNNANPYYKIAWELHPNLAMDIVVPIIAHFMTVETAGRMFVFASQILIISGAFALEWSAKFRHEISVLAALLTLHSMPFSLGLVNFEFGTGLALWGISAWIYFSNSSEYHARVVAHVFFSCALFLSHLFSLGIYGLVVGILELRRTIAFRRSALQSLKIYFLLVFPVAVMFGIMLLTTQDIGVEYNRWLFGWKFIWFLLYLNGYNVALASGSAAAVAILLLYGSVRGYLSLSEDGRWIAFGLFVVFLAIPTKLFGGGLADVRLIAAASLVLPAFTTLTPRAGSFRYLGAVVLGAIILINSSYVGYVWASYQRDYRAIKASFTLLRQKSFILVGSAPGTDASPLMDAPMWRAPTLAVYYRKAFVSSVYTIPGMQIIEVKPELRHLDINTENENYQPPSLATLKKNAAGENVGPQYTHNWQNDFDYLYLVGPHVPNALPNILVEIATDKRFTVYRIRKARPSKEVKLR